MKPLVIIGLITLILLPAVVFGDQGQLDAIRDIPGMEQARKQLPVHIGEYNGKGFIDAIRPNRVVINDIQYDMVPGIIITDLSGAQYAEGLKAGIFVYYFLDSQNRMSKIVVEK